MPEAGLNLFDLVPGKVLHGRFRILSPHRQAGMSAAFEVHDVESDEPRELQVFLGGLFEDREQARAFAERLEGWKELDAPAIVKLHRLDVLGDGSVLYVSDLPRGRPLRKRLEKGRLPVEAGVALGCALLESLAVAHRAKLAHGDLKPEVIWLDGDDALTSIVDGGVTPSLWAAKHLGTRTALIGTPYYAPIEQFTGDSPDERSDLYNVATVLYETLAGVLPWKGRSYVEVFQSKMQKTPPPMRELAPDAEVPREIEAVIAVGLSAVRRERYASADEFLERLSAVAPA